MNAARPTSRLRRFAAFLLGRETPETVAREAELRTALADLDARVSAGTLTQAQAEQALAQVVAQGENGAYHAEGPEAR